jgi:hypothetical protein
MNDKVSKAFNGDRHDPDALQNWLTQALQIQKQCTQALKAKGAIDYMATLRPTTKT